MAGWIWGNNISKEMRRIGVAETCTYDEAKGKAEDLEI
jgi:hypothetical protein